MLKRMKQMKVSSIIKLFSAIIVALLVIIAVLAFFVFDKNDETRKKDEIQYNDVREENKNIIVFEAETENGTAPSKEDMAAAENILRKRLDFAGYNEGTVRIEDGKFVVGLPGYDAEIAEILRQPAELTFNYAELDENGEMTPGEVVLSGDDVEKAESVFGVIDTTGVQRHYVTLTFTDEGSKKFSEATEKAAAQAADGTNVIFICIDGAPISQPMVYERIESSEAMITFSTQSDEEAGREARDLALLINSGCLPFELKEIENQ